MWAVYLLDCQVYETDFSGYYGIFSKEDDDNEEPEIFISEDIDIASVLNNKILHVWKETDVELTGLFPHNLLGCSVWINSNGTISVKQVLILQETRNI